MKIVRVAGSVFNDLFGSIPITEEMKRAASEFAGKTEKVVDVPDEVIVSGFRCGRAIREIMKRYGGGVTFGLSVLCAL